MKPIITLAILFLFALHGPVFAQQKDDGKKQEKKTAAVLDFMVISGITKDEAAALTSKFRSSLAKTKKYLILERNDMEAILKEQDFSMTDNCNSSECAVEVGKLLAAEKIVLGDVGKVGEMYTVTVRVVDISTAKMDITESSKFKGKSEGLIEVFDELAQKVTGTYRPNRTWYYIGGAAVLAGAGGYLLLGKEAGKGKPGIFAPGDGFFPGNP